MLIFTHYRKTLLMHTCLNSSSTYYLITIIPRRHCHRTSCIWCRDQSRYWTVTKNWEEKIYIHIYTEMIFSFFNCSPRASWSQTKKIWCTYGFDRIPFDSVAVHLQRWFFPTFHSLQSYECNIRHVQTENGYSFWYLQYAESTAEVPASIMIKKSNLSD